MKTGRNDPCPCGNSKKYKRCYGAESSDCTLYKSDNINKQMLEHGKKEKNVTKSILGFTQELSNLFYKTEKGGYPVSSRMQLIGCFSIIDVLANYWFEYLGRKDGTPSLRFYEYINSFCFNDKNLDFKNSKNLKDLNTENFYKFRCGLVHFYGLSVPNLVIMPNIDDKFTEADMQEYKQKLGKANSNLIYIQSLEIKNIIYKGAELMLLTMIENIQKSQTDEIFKQKHIEGVNRIYEKMQKEGAILVPMKEMEEIRAKIQ
ncbi:MAG: hypothetical protein Q7R78_02315 [bacterium]|nr:hypothetical protein [bacterium]